MAELTPEQQAVLQQAAVELRDQLLSEIPDVESSAVRCASGATVIDATDADASAIEMATRPVRDSLASDPATASFIERIETLKAELPAPSWPATCGAAPPTEGVFTRIPDGTYTALVTKADTLRLGVEDECTLSGGVKTVTLVLQSGRFTELHTCDDGETEVGSEGIYAPEGERVVFSEPGYPGSVTFDWSFDDGTLTLSIAESTAVEDLSVIRALFEHAFELAMPSRAPTTIPDGTYVTAVSRDDAMRTGWQDPCALDGGDKSVILVVEGDRFTELQRCGDAPIEVGSKGELEFDGDHVTLAGPEYPLRPTFAWSLDDGSLTLSIVDADPEELAVLQFLFEHEFEVAST
jgi:hypothetical protein